ncbi:uncharacterized protein LOC130901367 [Diorhabda carinulata]|uniref:uncharacterized protein LOC130901367 n=1 Tax=Diorhabda carinulata TaxID=1163345 RepID=UPI0025A1F055|nr:uncharacterized protein LOC130901367 [Diorhabda carinulata]
MTSIQPLVTHFRPFLRLLESRTVRRQNSRHGQSCDFDCCGKPIVKADDVVVEKDLEPCSFETWKPKIPVLCPEPVVEKRHPIKLKPKVCYAEMQPPPSPAELTKKGKDCLAKFSPSNIPKPVPQPQSIHKVSCCEKPKPTPKPKLPFPDWDLDCKMDGY